MIATKSRVFRFADVTVREREFAVIKAGLVQQVEPKAFRVLLILLRNANKLISKEELLNSVWADAAVTENSLARNIALLRRILGDEPRDPHFIETVAGIGYRFVCPVESSEDPDGSVEGTHSGDVASPNGNDRQTLNREGGAEPPAKPGLRDGDRVEIPASAESRAKWAISAVAALICLGVGTWFYFARQGHSLTDKDSIVLADFANTTGDSVFDGTLRQGLVVQLTQSPFLNLVSDQQIQRTLALMGHAQGARLDYDTARQICQRIAAAAVVAGSIASLGSEYILNLKAISCRTGDALANAQVQAPRKEDVLKALSHASGQLREKLGESLGTVEKFDTPLDQATTPSLDALLAYTLGRRELIWHGNVTAAMPLFQRAIDLDPNFAMAHLSLGLCHVNLGQVGMATESIRKAFELREHVSEWEKFAIESRYYLAVIGNLPRARQVYKLWALIYPREDIPVSVLGQEVDPALGRYEDALADSREALARSPRNPENYEALVVAYIYLNQLDGARKTADEANRQGLDSTDLHQHLYHVAFLQDNQREMAQEAAWAAGKPGVEDVLMSYEADTAAFHGQLEKAREFSRRAIASAQQAAENETAAGYQAQSAIREALFGNVAEARKRATDALASSTSRDVEARAAFALALAGATTEHLVDDLAGRFPEDTMVQFIFLPLIRAQFALNHHGATQALKELAASAPFELGNASPMEEFPFALYPCYLRGNAFLASNKGKEAAAEFQKILDHRNIVMNEPIGALAYEGLARAYGLQRQAEKARGGYQEFLSLWHEHDAGIPVLHEAESELSRLRTTR